MMHELCGAPWPLCHNALTILTAKLLLSAVNYSDLFADQLVRYAGECAPPHGRVLAVAVNCCNECINK